MNLTNEERELLQMIRDSSDPAKALMIAVDIILANIPGTDENKEAV